MTASFSVGFHELIAIDSKSCTVQFESTLPLVLVRGLATVGRRALLPAVWKFARRPS